MNETVLAVLAIIAAVLSAASMALHLIAPRTKTTVDDALRDKIDELLALVRGVVPAPPSVTVTNVTNPAPAQGPSSNALGNALVALLAIGLAGSVVLAPGCATARPRATAGTNALLDCTAPDRAALVDSLGVALRGYALKYISGDKQTVDLDKLKADARKLKGEVIGSCGLVAALAALATPPPAAARSLLAPTGPDPSEWAAALAVVRVELGVGAVRAAGG